MNERENIEERRQYNGNLTFYHPNGRNKGAAARFELRLNRPGETSYDCFFLEMAPQKTAGTRESSATFDWDNKITVKLGFMDICEFLSVMERQTKSVGGKNNSLYHQTNGASTLIGFKARDDGRGFWLGLSKKKKGDQSSSKVSLALSSIEAIGLKNIFQAGLFFMTFHGSLHSIILSANVQPRKDCREC